MMVAKRFSDDGVGRVVAGLANIASTAWDWTVVIAANLNEPLPGSLTGTTSGVRNLVEAAHDAICFAAANVLQVL